MLTRTEFSRRLGVSLSTLNRGIKKNEWPFNTFTKIGNQIRYSSTIIDSINRNKLLDSQLEKDIRKYETEERSKKKSEVEITFAYIAPYIKKMLETSPENGICTLNLQFNNGKIVRINEVKDTGISY
jgi:hypothetical protein